MSFKKFYMVPLLYFLLIQTLSGVQIPLESKIILNPSRTVTSRVENNKLHITIGKTAKKIAYAGLLLHFRKPQDCRDFQNVRFNICSSQKIRVKCSFGEMKKNVYTNWSRQSADAGEKEFLFERNSFIFPPEKEQILSSVKQITIGFGLWQYDTTKESAEIELSGIQITQPSDVFIIPMPTAGVSIDGTYRDWGHEDVLYNWTPPAYIKLDARHRLPSHTKPSKDLSGRYSLMYDDKNIYFLALIADPTPKQGQYGANPWQNDSIELFLALNPDTILLPDTEEQHRSLLPMDMQKQ